MRFAYFLAVIIAATLHASGNALSTTQESNHAIISNVAAQDIGNAAQLDGGRRLREKHTEDDDEELAKLEKEVEEEERFLGKVGKSIKSFASKKTQAFKNYREAQRGAKDTARAKRDYENFIEAGGRLRTN